jgi:hypothetical protein
VLVYGAYADGSCWSAVIERLQDAGLTVTAVQNPVHLAGRRRGAHRSQNRTISPELKQFMASRMNATTVHLDSGHLSLVSHPQQITQLILDAARAARE